MFSWTGASNTVAEKLVASIDRKSDDEMADAMVRFAFEMVANTFASPDWWEKRNQDKQKALLRRITSV